MTNTCPYCGSHLAESARFCSICGRPLDGLPSDVSMAPPEIPSGAAPPPLPIAQENLPYIPNYLVHSILATVFCCMPFGIVAIVFAAQVNSKLAWGDIVGATESSEKAKKWYWIAFWVGLSTNGLIFCIQIAIAISQNT